MTGVAIETSDLTRTFGSVRAVAGLNLHVPSGRVYGFLGPNGAGKTTTIRMLLGLVRPDRGKIRFFDGPSGESPSRAVRRAIGAMVESPSLYPHLTGSENLAITQGLLGLDARSVQRALGIVGLDRDAHRLVAGYSLGMRQRLALALALLAQPTLLVLDEPTNGLDPAGIHEMRELLRRLPTEQGVTVCLSSHLLAEVEQVASHVGIIDQGRLLFEGTLSDLHARRGDRLLIEVDQPAAALALLREAGWRAEQGDGELLLLDYADRADIAAIATALVHRGLKVYELRPTHASLEDVFLELTSVAQPSNQFTSPAR